MLLHAQSAQSSERGDPGSSPARPALAEPVRVFQLIKSLGRGGAETLLLENLRFSDKGRFQYGYGYFLPWKNALVPALEGEGATVSCFEARNNFSIVMAAKQVARQLRRSRADLLHCHLPIAGVVGRIAGRMAGVPVVYTEHNKMERYHPVTRRLSLSTWSWQRRVFAVSEGVAESIRAHAGDTVPVQVVLNGVDVERFDRRGTDAAPVRSALGIPERAPVVGTVAVFRVQKRLDHWLEAAVAVRSARPDVHFLMVGDGPLREELEQRATQLGLGGAVHWVGLQEEVRPYLAAMDVYLMSSTFEGLPIALLEAMSMRCAVVSTAVGGIPELVEDGESGFLAPPEQPEALARVVREVLSSPDLMRKVGEGARQKVVDAFGIRRMTQQLEHAYLEELGMHQHVG